MSRVTARPKISFVPKHPSNIQQKVEPSTDSTQITSIKTVTTSFNDGRNLIPSRSISVLTQISPHLKKPVECHNGFDEQEKHSTLNHQSIAVAVTNKTESTPETKTQPKSQLKECVRNLSPRQRLILKILIIVLIIIVCISALVVPLSIVYGKRQTSDESSFTNLTATVCSTSTCISQETPFRSSMTTLLYMMDGSTNDLAGYAAGTLFGVTNPNFISVGYAGQCLNLFTGSMQYMMIPAVNFAQSFTIQLWFFSSVGNMTSEMGLFGQCDTYNVCLSLSIRNGRVVFWIDSMNSSSTPLIGSTVIGVFIWNHISVTYDARLFQQKIFVNGQIDAISNGIVPPYRGITSTANAAISRSLSLSGIAYSTARIDHVVFSVGSVRNYCQILNDASLIAYYPFDSTNTLNDYSAYVSNGIAGGITVQSSGRINQAISFTSSSSYFQAQCFSSIRTRMASYTLALWIRPSITTSGTLVHVSTASSGGGICYDLLVFSPTGSLVFQHLTAALTLVPLENNTISARVWTHVAVMYSASNGLRLFINGQIVATSSNAAAINYYDPGAPSFLTLGNISPLGSSASLSCNVSSASISSGFYDGFIDDFRLYNRELDSEELCVLTSL